jgi:hypothetical protein
MLLRVLWCSPCGLSPRGGKQPVHPIIGPCVAKLAMYAHRGKADLAGASGDFRNWTRTGHRVRVRLYVIMSFE